MVNHLSHTRSLRCCHSLIYLQMTRQYSTTHVKTFLTWTWLLIWVLIYRKSRRGVSELWLVNFNATKTKLSVNHHRSVQALSSHLHEGWNVKWTVKPGQTARGLKITTDLKWKQVYKMIGSFYRSSKMLTPEAIWLLALFGVTDSKYKH